MSTRTAAALVLVLLLPACSLLGDRPAATAFDEAGMRSDPEPLTRRFPALGTPRSVRWQSGRVGDNRVPGPSTLWIDAVVTLEPQVAANLRVVAAQKDPAWAGKPQPVDLVPGVAAEVPDGQLVGSQALDSEVSHEQWYARVRLVEGRDVLLLSAHGE